MLVITIPAVILADRISRRVSVISAGLIMAACIYTISSLYASSGVHRSREIGRRSCNLRDRTDLLCDVGRGSEAICQ